MLIFDGNCGEAAEFYRKMLGPDLYMRPYVKARDDSGNPENRGATDRLSDRIVSATLLKGSAVLLMASDTVPGSALPPSQNISVVIRSDGAEETEKLFAAFGEKAWLRCRCIQQGGVCMSVH